MPDSPPLCQGQAMADPEPGTCPYLSVPQFSPYWPWEPAAVLQEELKGSAHVRYQRCCKITCPQLPLTLPREKHEECTNMRRFPLTGSGQRVLLQGTCCEAWWKAERLDFVLGLRIE